MAERTTDTTSADTPRGNGIDEAAEAFQDQLTPGRRKTQDTDTEDDPEAQQGKKPTGKRAKAPPADEGDDDDQDDDGDDDGDDEDEGKKHQGDESEEGEDEESDPESDGEDDPDRDPDLDVTYTVTHADGTEEDIPVSELVKGYFRQKDYTRKTQAVAEERRQVHGERQEVSAMRVQYARGLEQLQDAIKQATPQEPDWEALKRTDPIGYAEQWADWQRQQVLVQQIEQERQAVLEQEQHEREAHRREVVKAGQQWLLQQIPEWKDEKKARADRAEMKAFAMKVGFSAEELKAVDDPRAVLLIRQAMLYAKLQEKKPLVIKQKHKVPASAGSKTPVLKPQAVKSPVSRQASRLNDAKKRHAKEQSVDSAAGFFRTLL